MKSWTDLFRSTNATVRARAAKAMLDSDQDFPLPLLLGMLDDHVTLGFPTHAPASPPRSR